MATPELIEGVKKSLESGKPTAQVEREMLSNGWSKEDVRSVFLSLGLPCNLRKSSVLKKLGIILVIIIVIGFAYFFLFLKTPAIDQVYRDSEYGFSMMYPSGYKPKDIAQNKDAINKIAESRGWNKLIKTIGFSPSSGAKTNFLPAVSIEKPPENSGDFNLNATIEKFSSSFPGYRDLGSVDREINSYPAIQKYYYSQESFDNNIKINFKNKTLMSYKNGYIYIFNVSWIENYKNGENMADIILESISL